MESDENQSNKVVSKISMKGVQNNTYVIRCLKKKLLVLDINGLLADIVSPPPEGLKPDTIIARRAIFKRPFYLEFLNFCFEKFEVAVWSSRTKYPSPISSQDASHCTKTTFKTVENKHKPVVFKDMRKIWEKHDPSLPWEKGYYNESNTLLLDDSPYKALLNPPQNSVFPHTFSFQNRSDNSLGDRGDLRKYLDGLANAENMNKYVEEHPFGQQPITKTSPSWNYYHNVVATLSTSQHGKSDITYKVIIPK
ncbi:uncharacterized protein LOC107486250 [Arachis duranensis]|uniref:Mitochondrial import inner membrane translocase subunit TIM50 n=1 Tax=Arachis duranensis TaxID=130453 RepID=A0A6P5NIC2_ARADU|nr:uncharacterized protein LOC107486250 [Arachis duranensis]